MSRARFSRRQAVALKWRPGLEKLPKVSAKGSETLADEIIRIAKAHDIPIREDHDLVQILSLLDIGDAIPPEIHTAIAEILAFIYWSNQQYTEIFEAKGSNKT